MKEFEVKEERTKTVYLRKSYVLRGIKEHQTRKEVVAKEVVAEKGFDWIPDEQEIAQFLYDNKEVSFCVVEQVFSIVE